MPFVSVEGHSPVGKRTTIILTQILNRINDVSGGELCDAAKPWVNRLHGAHQRDFADDRRLDPEARTAPARPDQLPWIQRIIVGALKQQVNLFAVVSEACKHRLEFSQGEVRAPGS